MVAHLPFQFCQPNSMTQCPELLLAVTWVTWLSTQEAGGPHWPEGMQDLRREQCLHLL